MRFAIGGASVLTLCVFVGFSSAEPPKATWSMNTTVIESCSCPMFCQCFFNTKPASHGGHHGAAEEHFCRANNAYRVNRGKYGSVILDGVKFWIAADLGDDFSDGEFDWAILTFDPSATKEQRDAIAAILGHVYPVKWKSFSVAPDAPIEWGHTKDRAEARLDGGKIAEIVLKRFPGMTSEPVVIRNLKYFGVPRNNGFVMMPNEIEAYRAGDKPFEFRGTNGFMITIDMTSRDVK